MNFEFEWDSRKDSDKQDKHGISFAIAMQAFYDDERIITQDPAHSIEEKRYFCYGKVDGTILTVRFTYRKRKIRIIGAARWRKGNRIYAQKNKL